MLFPPYQRLHIVPHPCPLARGPVVINAPQVALGVGKGALLAWPHHFRDKVCQGLSLNGCSVTVDVKLAQLDWPIHQAPESFGYCKIFFSGASVRTLIGCVWKYGLSGRATTTNANANSSMGGYLGSTPLNARLM